MKFKLANDNVPAIAAEDVRLIGYMGMIVDNAIKMAMRLLYPAGSQDKIATDSDALTRTVMEHVVRRAEQLRDLQRLGAPGDR